MADAPSARWRIGLRERLLAITLLVAVVAIVLTAWAVNRQTESELRGALRDELNKPQLVYNFFTKLGEEAPDTWADDLALAQAAERAAAQYELRVRLEYAGGGQLLWDSSRTDDEPAPPRPPVLAIRLPAPSEDGQVDQGEAFAVEQRSEDTFRDCMQLNGEAVRESVDASSGVRRYEPADPSGVDPAVLGTCSERRDATADGPVAQTYYGEDLLLYVVNPRLSSASNLGEGINTRLVLTVLGVVLLAVLTTTLGARHLLQPIGRLTRASRQMAAGKLDERVPEDRGDELGDLSRAFNSMAASLEQADTQRRRMTSDIAHELRTPLSNIRGYLEAAQDGVAPLTPALIDSLHEDTLLLQTLVSDLQELTVAESGGLVLQRSPTDLGELAHSVAAAHRPRARAGGVDIVVEVAGAPGGVAAEVDQRRFRQVLTNLVENGLRHTPEGGTITLRARRAGDDVVVEVADTGSGIEPEHLPHIFDRFYRGDPSRHRSTGGTGLGLAITRELVHAHGGTITPQSALGEGTTFTIRLPAGPPAPASGPQGSAAAGPPASGGGASGGGGGGGNGAAATAGNGATRSPGHGRDLDHVHVN